MLIVVEKKESGFLEAVKKPFVEIGGQLKT